MDYAIIKQMVKDEIIDFNKLLLQNYKKIGLTEIEAFVLIELHNQRKTGKTVISPSKLVKKLTISEEKLFSILDGLVIKQYLSIQKEIDRAVKRTLQRGWFVLGENVEKDVASILVSMQNLKEIILSGRLTAYDFIKAELTRRLNKYAPVVKVNKLSKIAKEAACGAYIIGEGLLGGKYRRLVENMGILNVEHTN